MRGVIPAEPVGADIPFTAAGRENAVLRWRPEFLGDRSLAHRFLTGWQPTVVTHRTQSPEVPLQRPTKRTTVLAGIAGLGAAGALGIALVASPAQAEDPTPAPSSSSSAPSSSAPSSSAPNSSAPNPSAPDSSAPGAPAPGGAAPGAGRPDRAADRAARQEQLAAALATELGIDKDKVAAALEKVQADREAQAKADRLADLKTRLDAAVKEGKLTAEQSAAILKAAEAGVFPQGGGRGGHGR
jgi:hypothetical protein